MIYAKKRYAVLKSEVTWFLTKLLYLEGENIAAKVLYLKGENDGPWRVAEVRNMAKARPISVNSGFHCFE